MYVHVPTWMEHTHMYVHIPSKMKTCTIGLTIHQVYTRTMKHTTTGPHGEHRDTKFLL